MPSAGPGDPRDPRDPRQRTRELVARFLTLEPAFAATGEVPAEIEPALKEQGYLGLTIPADYGGLGLSALAACAVFEELARMPLGFFTSVRSNNSIGSRALARFGSEEQRRRWLPRIASGEILTAFALTEPEAGSDVAAIRASARRDEEHYVLNGTKHYITNAPRADLVTVVARTHPDERPGRAMSCFLVETSTPGFRVREIQRTMAGPPHVQAIIDLHECRVPAGNLIGEPGQGFKIAMTTLNEGRLHVSAIALGIAQAALDAALAHARERVAFGRPIGEFQAIQHKLADMATQIFAGREMLQSVCRRFDAGEEPRAEVSMVKLFTTELAGRVVDEALQIHGGRGYLWGEPVERMYRDVRLLRIIEGTSEIQRTIIGRALLDGFTLG